MEENIKKNIVTKMINNNQKEKEGTEIKNISETFGNYVLEYIISVILSTEGTEII